MLKQCCLYNTLHFFCRVYIITDTSRAQTSPLLFGTFIHNILILPGCHAIKANCFVIHFIGKPRLETETFDIFNSIFVYIIDE